MTIELATDDDYEAEPVVLTPPRTIGNHSTTTAYVSEISKIPARGEGAMRAYQIKSRTGLNADLTSRSGGDATAGGA